MLIHKEKEKFSILESKTFTLYGNKNIMKVGWKKRQKSARKGGDNAE